MLQTALVAFIVLSAALYSVWSLMPATARRNAAAALARQASRLGARAHTARRIEAQLASAGGGCSDCNSCKACGPAAPVQGASPSVVIAMPKSRRQALG
jgi:hypothetical protein